MTYRALCLALLALHLGLPARGAAQSAVDAPKRWWVAGGVGGGGSGEMDGIAGVIQAVHQRGPHHFALRWAALAEWMTSGGGALGEIGALYGRTVSTGAVGHIAVAAGLAATANNACEPDPCTTLGIPVVAELALTPSELLGIGAQVFANLNDQAVYGGLAVLLQLGWMP